MEWSSFDDENVDDQVEKELDVNVQSCSIYANSKHKDPRRAVEILQEQKQLSKELQEFIE